MTKKLSETLRRKAAEQGLLPHEILLKVARGEPIKHTEVQPDGTLSEVDLYPALDVRIDAAKAAAPYYAPRLSSQHVDMTTTLDDLSDEELDARIKELMREQS